MISLKKINPDLSMKKRMFLKFLLLHLIAIYKLTASNTFFSLAIVTGKKS